MKRIFLAPHSALAGTTIGSACAHGITDDQLILVLESGFQGCAADFEDWFLAQPGVLELFPWDQEKPAPQALTVAISKSAISAMRSAPVSTLRDALRAVGRLRWYD